VNGVTYDFHILPSGLINPRCINLVGSGCVVHIPSFFKELEALDKHGLNTKDRIFISDRAHVVLDLHQLADGLEEVELGEGFIGMDILWC
jgi:adenylosuccinate synthase